MKARIFIRILKTPHSCLMNPTTPMTNMNTYANQPNLIIKDLPIRFFCLLILVKIISNPKIIIYLTSKRVPAGKINKNQDNRYPFIKSERTQATISSIQFYPYLTILLVVKTLRLKYCIAMKKRWRDNRLVLLKISTFQIRPQRRPLEKKDLYNKILGERESQSLRLTSQRSSDADFAILCVRTNKLWAAILAKIIQKNNSKRFQMLQEE